jgi:hypothetical protein
MLYSITCFEVPVWLYKHNLPPGKATLKMPVLYLALRRNNWANDRGLKVFCIGDVIFFQLNPYICIPSKKSWDP